MLTAAKEGTFSASSDPCVLFSLAASEGVPKNSRLGFARKNVAPHQGSAWSNSGKALGIREVVWENCGGSDDSARYYEPGTGRFLTEDPVGFRGHDINLYRYVRNRPNAYTDPIGLVTIDPTFNTDCLPALKRALDIVRKLPKKCDCAFKKIGSHRSLKQLVDDPSITIHYTPEPSNEEDAHTEEGDTHNIWIRPFPCREGRWSLASILIHELVHITLVPGLGQDDPNGPAYGMQRACGLLPLSNIVPVGGVAFPPPEPSHYSPPNTLVEP